MPKARSPPGPEFQLRVPRTRFGQQNTWEVSSASATMMLAGERPRLRRSLPPSERNYSLGCLSRQLYRLSDSEATAGGAKGGRVPPLALNLVVLRSWPPLPALVFWAVAQLTSTGSVPGEKTRAEYVGTVQKEPEFVCRGGVRNVPLPPPPPPPRPGSQQRRELARRSEGLEERSPNWPRRSQPDLPAPPPPPTPRGSANRRTRGSACQGQGSGPHCACPAVRAGGRCGSRRRAARSGN